jgi:diguanylate cyclase (GGDEF)-like protein
MSIRFRVAVLALITLVGVVSTTWIGYRDIRSELATLSLQTERNAWIGACSDLVHRLQLERGNSAGAWDGKTAAEIRRATDEALAGLLAMPQSTAEQLARSGLVDLDRRLAGVRNRVDARLDDWKAVRDAYSAIIASVLDAVQGALQADERLYLRDLVAIDALVHAREALGFLRATLNYALAHPPLRQDDMPALAARTILYQHYIHDYIYLAAPDHADKLRQVQKMPEHVWVMATLDRWLYGRTPDLQIERGEWWGKATYVIDALKQREEALYGDLRRQTDQRTAALQTRLQVYSVAAVLLVLVVLGFAGGSINRIMSALGLLVRTLDTIVQKENFALRLPGERGRDEFSQLGQALNKLLDFTDTLLREKERLAATDALTGVMNRRSFVKYANREISRARRHGNALSLIFFDIDHFKRVNDTFGHAAGDEVLQCFVGVLQNRARDSDLTARWGGEEFVMLAPETTVESALRFAELLRQSIEAAKFPVVGQVTCSLGVAAWQPGEDLDAFCARADQALYRAKKEGRNRVCLAEPETTGDGE